MSQKPMDIRKRTKSAIAAASLAILLACGVSTPAYAWGSGTILMSGTTGQCWSATANKWSSTNASNASAGTNESGNYCPGGAPLLSAALRYVSNYNGGGAAASTYTSGYKSVATTAAAGGVYRGGVHNFGGVPATT